PGPAHGRAGAPDLRRRAVPFARGLRAGAVPAHRSGRPADRPEAAAQRRLPGVRSHHPGLPGARAAVRHRPGHRPERPAPASVLAGVGGHLRVRRLVVRQGPDAVPGPGQSTASMTSVDLMTTVTGAPTPSPRSSAAPLVMLDVISCPPPISTFT